SRPAPATRNPAHPSDPPPHPPARRSPGGRSPPPRSARRSRRGGGPAPRLDRPGPSRGSRRASGARAAPPRGRPSPGSAPCRTGTTWPNSPPDRDRRSRPRRGRGGGHPAAGARGRGSAPRAPAPGRRASRGRGSETSSRDRARPRYPASRAGGSACRAYGRGLAACQYTVRRVAPLILVDGLRKRFGIRVALDGVGLAVGPGEIVGLLGPNGAGKSTTLSILATLLPFDAGNVTIADHPLPAAAARARRELGFVPQQVALYPTLSARENLRFFARTLGLAPREAARSAADVLSLIGLESRAGEPVSRFSVGMRRRLNLGCGILHRPRVLLLDEPAV